MARTKRPAAPAMTAISQLGNGLPATSFSSGMGSPGTEVEIGMVVSFHNRYTNTEHYK